MSHYDIKEKRALAVYVSIFLLLVLSIAVGGRVSYRNFEEEFRHQAEMQVSAIAELKSNQLADWRRERFVDAQSFYRNSVFSGLVERYFNNSQDSDARRQIYSRLEYQQSYAGYERICLLDETGVLRFSIPVGPAVVNECQVKDAAAVLKSREISFLDIKRDDSVNGELYISIFVPVFSAQNSNDPLGLLVFRVDPETYLFPFINHWPIPSDTAETLLVRRDGEDVLYLNQLRFEPDAALKLRIPLTESQLPAVKAVLGQTGLVEGLDYRGKLVLADVRPVPDSPWFMVSKVDVDEVYAPLRERLWQTLLIVGLAILVAGAGLALVWRQQRVLSYRAKAEVTEVLRASEEKFRKAFILSPDSININRLSDGMYVSINNGFTKIMGYTPDQVIGKTSLELNIWVDPQDRKMLVDGLKKKGEVENLEARFCASNGDIKYGLMSASILELNGIPHIISITRDITERKQAEDQIRQFNMKLEQRVLDRTLQLETTNKELEAFSYSVSHDLRAPLRGIDGWSQALLEDYHDQLDAQGQQYIERVRSETQRMGHLIDDMLRLSRLVRAEMIKEQVELSAIARDVVERLKQDEPHRQVDFSIQAGLTAQGDPHLLESVLANLLGNAFKFTGKRADARIEFGQTELKEQHVFFVRDNGAGFNMMYAQKLFGAFQRMHKDSEFPGTGIGLATVQRIIHRHGGRVWAEAEIERGATFYFTLG